MRLPNNIGECHDLIKALLQQVAFLSQEVKELKAQINKNSRNSSKPPSSDGYRKKPALPKPKKKRGGQEGHKGDTLKMVDQPDSIEKLIPQRCLCGHSLVGIAKELIESRQVFDIPHPELLVSEYQSYQCECPGCKQQVYAPFPEHVKAPVQYGSGVKTLVTILNNKFHLSWERISELFYDLFGHYINANTQDRTYKQAYEILEAPMAQITGAISQSPVAHGDETGMRVNGKLQWLHNLSTPWYTYIFCHERRGKIAMESAQSLVADYSGILVHDCYASYFKLQDCQHAICGAHLIRELQGLIENETPWAVQMQQFLLDLYKKVQSGYRLTKRHKLWRQYDLICETADEYEPPPIKRPRGKPKKTTGRNLFDRLVKYKQAVLLFATHPDVPFTNNQAERDIRPAKIKQKNAGCFRTKKGVDRFCRIYSFLSTMRKLQRNVFNELFDLFEGQSFNLGIQVPK